MAAKLTRLTHKIAIQLERAVPLALLVPGGQSGNFWKDPHIRSNQRVIVNNEFGLRGDDLYYYCIYLNVTRKATKLLFVACLWIENQIRDTPDFRSIVPRLSI
jgi:hypothetical protein